MNGTREAGSSGTDGVQGLNVTICPHWSLLTPRSCCGPPQVPASGAGTGTQGGTGRIRPRV